VLKSLDFRAARKPKNNNFFMAMKIETKQDGAQITFLRELLPIIAAEFQRLNAIQAVSTLLRPIIAEVRNAGRIFRLNDPILVSEFCENAIFYCESKRLSILAFGHTQNEARRAFHEDFAVMWDEIAQSPDDQLTPGAKLVKDRFLALVNTVVPE
jgi:hypothetical protein